MPSYVDPTEQLVVELYVGDAQKTADFYRRFGFKTVREEPGFVELGWEGHRFFIEEQATPPPLADFPQANVRVMVPNVDDCWKLAQGMGARVLKPIADREYGLRDFTIADPDGFGVRFATRLSGR